jgi:hypothetical protein
MLILCLFFGILVFLIAMTALRWDKEMIPVSLFFSMGGVLLGIILSLALPVKTEEKVVESYKLEALQDGSGVSGKFFLGIGGIDSRMMYVYYVQDDDSTFKMETLSSCSASIKYTTGVPRLEVWEEVPIKGEIINLFASDWLIVRKNIFCVPIGTIKQSYNLDAQ